MGHEVTATDRVIERVQRSDMSPAKQRAFLGHLLLTSRGYPSKLAKETAADFNRLQRDLGVVLSSASFDEEAVAGFVSRLDFDSGREVVRAA